MKPKLPILLLASAAIALSGCALFKKSDETALLVPVTVSQLTNPATFIIVKQPIDDTDDLKDPEYGIVFPLGKYQLEAEDLSYRYYRAPKRLLMAGYEFGARRGGTPFYGGIALPKDKNPASPMYAYTDDKDKNAKLLVWKLTPAFASKHGQKWITSDDKQVSEAVNTLPADESSQPAK